MSAGPSEPIIMAKPSQPERICPACSAADGIRGGDRLWPTDWLCPSCGHGLVVRAGVPCLAPELDGEDVGFDSGAFETLAKVESGQFWFQVRNELIAWQHPWLWSESDDLGHHVRRYRVGEIEKR